MIGLLMKIVICPTVVVLSDYLSEGIFYPNIFQPLILGLVLALLAHMMEVMILREGTFWISNMVDLAAAFFVLYFGTLFLRGATITVLDAFSVAFVLGVTEYFQHLYLLRSGKTKKSQ